VADPRRGAFWRRLLGGRRAGPSPARRVALRDEPTPGPLFHVAGDEWQRSPQRPPAPPPRARARIDEDDEEDARTSGFGRYVRFGGAPRAALHTQSVVGAAGIVAVGFIASRLLGLLRTVAIADAFGTEPDLAAYWVAFRLPDLVFQLLAGGTVSAAFIPVFSRVAMERGEAGAWRLAASVVNLLAIATAALALLAFVFAPQLVPLLAPGLGEATAREAELRSLAVELTRFMLVSPIVFGISGLLTGILNARQHFVAPAFAPALYNLSIIFAAVFLSGPFGVNGLAWGVVIGSLLHLAVQAPVVFLVGMRWSAVLGLRSRAVRDVARLTGPRVVGLAAAQANFVVLIFFASFISDAAINAVNFAFLVMMLPVGVIGMAISTAAFPALAQHAAARQFGPLREGLAESLRAILFLAIPASVGLVVLARPVVRLLFERGAFDAFATDLVARALAVFAIGIAAHSAIEILSRGFYALSDTKTPVRLAVLAMLLNVVLSALLVGPLGLRGLAGAASLAAIVEVTWLGMLLRRRLRGFGPLGIWRSVSRTLIASALMAEVVVVARLVIAAAGPGETTAGGALAIVAGATGAGLVAYLVASWVLNRDQVEALLGRQGGR